MFLVSPVVITPRLLPGVQVGGAFVSIGYLDSRDDGRQGYQWHIDLENGESFSGDDLASGCGGGDLHGGLSSLLSFLGAFAESVGYERRTGRRGENSDLFPRGLAEWAEANADELFLLQEELDANPVAIDED
jgi:hypothetical protein